MILVIKITFYSILYKILKTYQRYYELVKLRIKNLLHYSLEPIICILRNRKIQACHGIILKKNYDKDM